MKPYYVDSSQTISLYHGDCREVINSLPVDDYVTIADPPYGETKQKWDTWPVGWTMSKPKFVDVGRPQLLLMDEVSP